MGTRSKNGRLGVTLGLLGALAFAALALHQPVASADTLLRWANAESGNVRPIVLHAENITTWTEYGRRVLLLRGKVWVEQGVVQARMREAVVWVEEEQQKKTGVAQLHIYAEGDVSLENGAKNISGQKPVARALIELSTRGDVKIKSYSSKVSEKIVAQDPLYVRGREERYATPAQEVIPAKTWPGPEWTLKEAGREMPAPPPVIQQTQHEPPPVAPPPGSGPVVPPGGGTAPPLPLVPPTPEFGSPQGVPALPPPELGAPRPAGSMRQLIIRPRSSQEFKSGSYPLPNGETAVVVTSGVILGVSDPERGSLIDIEADRLVFWTRGDFQKTFDKLRSPEGQSASTMEFYLSGNVAIRSQSGKETHILRADEVYYDVNRNVAIALNGDLEVRQPGLPDPIHLQSAELLQISPNLFQVGRSSLNASKLPYGPGLKIGVSSATLEKMQVPKVSLLGIPFLNPDTGEQRQEEQQLFRGKNVFISLEGIPIFYLPYLQGDANDPLGPLQNVGFSQNRIFGTQVYTTWNVYDLFGLTPLPGTRWRLGIDYLGDRGPALGSDFSFAGRDLFGIPGRSSGLLKAYGLHDGADDILGGNRGRLAFVPTPGGFTTVPITHPEWRGRFLGQLNMQEMPLGLSLQAQVSALSDHNLLDQYYNAEFMNGLNQETFLYLKQQNHNWAWTALVEPRIRNWVTETEWLPRADGFLIGQKWFDLVTWNVHGHAGYAHLRPTDRLSPPFSATDVNTQTGRFGLGQDWTIPFSVGDVRLAPYGVLDLTYYTQDLTGEDRGRFYGGGGVRGSIPFSQLFPEAHSDLFNVSGIYHKINLTGNYFAAHSDTPLSRLPQLDRLHDDATDQALRDIRPVQALFNPRHGAALATSPLYDPQLYALRRLVDNRVDTLDTIEVVQLGLRQRWQTKRGFPGAQHIIDWMTLDLTGSFFPEPSRDNFGESAAFLEYDWTWHVGDRTTLFSNGLFDPIDRGTRAFHIGTELNRPDGTSFLLAFRHIDPIETRAILASLSFAFSAKYALTASSAYDFGNHVQVNSLTLTRVGKDLQLNVGVSYNSVLNNFGFNFEVFPNLLPAHRRVHGGGTGLLTSQLSGPR